MFVRHQRKLRSAITKAVARTTIETLEGRLLLAAQLDPTFGSAGIVKGPGLESYEVEVQSDGKVLVADDRGLIRYNANGSLDTSFGGGDGIADWGSLDDPGTTDDRPAISLLPDGKIIAAASDHTSGLVVVRFNSDGTRDTTFGPNGEVKPASGGGFWDVADVDFYRTNKILIAGDNAPRPFFNDFSITRLNLDGTPDTTFGGGDGRIDRTIRAYDELEGVLVQADGKIIAYGNSATATTGTQVPEPDQWAASMFRLHADGGIDVTFGNNGKVELPDDEMLMDAELQSTGKIVLLTDNGQEVRRLNPNGTLDLTFGENGSSGIGVSTNTGFSLIEGNDLLVRADDTILVGGHTMERIMPGETLRGSNAAVGKLSANGEQDGSFGGGFLVVDFGGNRDDIHALALQSGKIIAAGVAGNTDGTRTNALARITESGGGTGTGNGTGLRGEYFNNMDFTAPAFTRTDSTINFNWGTGSPDPRIQPDTFSVRWTGQVEAIGTGRYTFYTTSDDGVRLTVNGQRIIDKLSPQATTQHFGEIDLVAGQKYDITLEYFDRFGGANAKLEWQGPGIAKQIVPTSQLYPSTGSTGDTQAPSAVPNFRVSNVTDNEISVVWEAATDNVGVAGYELKLDNGEWFMLDPDALGWTYENLQPNTSHTISARAFDAAGNRGPITSVTATTTGGTTVNGLTGTYFNNMDFTSPVFTRTDRRVNYNWGTGAPATEMDPDTFSVRWTGKIQAPTTGRYTFYTTTDDGVRLTINGQRIIDKMVPQAATEWSGSIDLAAGQKYDIVLDYFERAGGAQASLSWSGPGISKEIVPESALFTSGGSTDTQAPTAVGNFRATRVSDTEIQVSWEPATDNTSVRGYGLQLDDNMGFSVDPDVRTFTFDGLAPGSPHTITIWAFDQSENFGPTSTVNATTTGGTTTNGLKGEYFNNMDFTGFSTTRIDPGVMFNWGTGSPAPGIEADTLSVRWTGQIEAEKTEKYTFYLRSDDGVRLWIDDQLVIDEWRPQSYQEFQGDIDLVAGQKYDIKVEYFDRFGHAHVELSWASPTTTRTAIPTRLLSPSA
jgi:uncharacterized delta-60 repeat protein